MKAVEAAQGIQPGSAALIKYCLGLENQLAVSGWGMHPALGGTSKQLPSPLHTRRGGF